MKPMIKQPLTEEDSKPKKYSDIEPAKISKKVYGIDLVLVHNNFFEHIGFPDDIVAMKNSAVDDNNTGPGKYYLEFTLKPGVKSLARKNLPKLRKAIREYISYFFNLDPKRVNSKLKNDEIIVYRTKADPSKYYVDFVITESKSDDNKVENLIECVANKQFDNADDLLTEIIKSKIVSKIHSIIK